MSSPQMREQLADFDANAVPLESGVVLLEASAGTGKTFALAHLVLRLVTRAGDPLPLERLLVVTFTDAAAAELRDRIARRLQQALALLEPSEEKNSPQLPAASDAVLAAWLDAQPADPGARQRLRGQLLLALEALDRADITTIHGFCRRTLQRQALEAGQGPALELERDGGEQAAQVIHDYWLQQVLSLPAGLLAGLQRQGITPELLERLLLRLDGDPALELEPLPPDWQGAGSLVEELPAWLERRWQQFTTAWRERGEALEQAFRQAAADVRSRGAGDPKPYAPRPKRNRAGDIDSWIAALEQGERSPEYDALLQQPLLQDYFHPAPFTKMAVKAFGESAASPASLPERPLLEAIAALVDGPAELVLSHALHHGRAELARRRAASGRLGFGGLLAALDPQGRGTAECLGLVDAVSRRYGVALIDEFQDTDPIQWRILERAFVATAGGPARHLLVMVGDPKQAIYRFRGGELATYRQARDRADRRYSLRENRRSSADLVAALNALMAPGLVRSDLPVPPVLACSSTGELPLEPGGSPLQLLPIENEEQLPGQVAALCLQLLREPRYGPLSPADLCLLVSTHRQAELLRHALEQRGLPSRLVSRGDVFASEAATALQRLLDALADPGHAGRQRLLAASPLLGWDAARLGNAATADWERLADRLAQLGQRLEQAGLLACVGELLSTEGLARLSLGGRLLADLQQAAELVQEQMHRLGLGTAAAADWLRRIRLEPDRRVPEEHQLNSTAADAAIALVTVHRSKGLEYPVVICPYLWRAPAAPTSKAGELGRRWLPPGATAPRLDLHRSPHWGHGRQAAQADLAAAEQEAERLAYVAATRARQLLVLGWLQDERHSTNPLAPWLLEAGELRHPDIVPLQPLDPAALPPAGELWRQPAPQGELQPGALPRHRLDTSWGRSSYSSWVHSGGSVPPAARDEGRDTSDPAAELPSEPGLEAVAAEAVSEEAVAEEAVAEEAVGEGERQGPLAQFPRGTGPGEALHRILERLDYSQSVLAAEPQALIGQELARAGLAGDLAETLSEGLERLRHTPFGGPLGSLSLAELEPGSWLNEMNFDLPLAVSRPGFLADRHASGAGRAGEEPPRLRSGGLARCFHQHPGGLFGPAYASRLEALSIASRGFLTGSIDLVFRQGERWWVLDWKSNWLGERDAAGGAIACGPLHYGQAAMAELMAASHYPLQAHLYLVALHRYLRWRLPGYSPERHLGGYAYVFLRGLPGPTPAALAQASAGRAVAGMLVEQPPLGRLIALDGLLREGER